MNEYNANNPSEMLHLLLDGELDSSMEASLFTSLLGNEELRNEMRELISIRESVRRDVEAFTPPISATSGIFSKLGYTIPLMPVSIPAATSLGFWANVGHKIWNPAFTAVLASLVTFILMWNFNSQGINENDSNQIADNNKTVANTSQANESLASSTQITNDNKSGQEVKVVYITKYIKDKPNNTVEVVNNDVENTDDNVNDTGNLNDIYNNLSFSPFDNVKLQPYQSNLNNSMTKEISLVNNYYSAVNNDPALTLQFKVMSGSSYPNINFSGTDESFITNFSIAAFAPVSEIFQIGLEAGKEPFGMEFYDIDDKDNRLYTIRQKPTLLWAGVGVKIISDKHIDFLAYSQPYLHLTMASTSVGPLVKTNAGLQFVSESGLGILLGLEGSLLAYQNENIWYSSKNLGIMYGMFMRF
jgi:hypothetical protein